jgi:hypothetical protein
LEVFPLPDPIDNRVRQGHADDEPREDGGQAGGFAGQEPGSRQDQRRDEDRELDDGRKEETSQIHGRGYEAFRRFVSFFTA